MCRTAHLWTTLTLWQQTSKTLALGNYTGLVDITCQHAVLAQQRPLLPAACILLPKRCSQDALIYHAGAHSTVLAGLLPSRRFSPSPCCHSPDSPNGALAPRSSGNTRACCAPHPANGVEGARVWGDAVSFRVGPGSSYNQA